MCVILAWVPSRDPVQAPQGVDAVHGLDEDINSMVQFIGSQQAGRVAPPDLTRHAIQ
jgi:hypothetical protein